MGSGTAVNSKLGPKLPEDGTTSSAVGSVNEASKWLSDTPASKVICGADVKEGKANQVAVEFISSPTVKLSPAARETGVIDT
jgi:hypothetical protein